MKKSSSDAFVDNSAEIKEADDLVKKYMTIQLTKFKYLNPQG